MFISFSCSGSKKPTWITFPSGRRVSWKSGSQSFPQLKRKGCFLAVKPLMASSLQVHKCIQLVFQVINSLLTLCSGCICEISGGNFQVYPRSAWGKFWRPKATRPCERKPWCCIIARIQAIRVIGSICRDSVKGNCRSRAKSKEATSAR